MPLIARQMENIKQLDEKQIRVLEQVANHPEDEVVAEQLHVSVASVQEAILEICNVLQIYLEDPSARRARAVWMYRQFKKKMDEENTGAKQQADPVANSAYCSSEALPEVQRGLPKRAHVKIGPLVSGIAKLSPRFKEVVSCLVQDMDDEQIAQKMGIAKNSPASMVSVISSKLKLPLTLPTGIRRQYMKAAALRAIGEVEASNKIIESVEKAIDEMAVHIDGTKENGPLQQDVEATEEDIERIAALLVDANENMKTVAQCIAANFTNDEIGTALRIHPTSVPDAVSRLYRFLDLPKCKGTKRQRTLVARAYQHLTADAAAKSASIKAEAPEEIEREEVEDPQSELGVEPERQADDAQYAQETQEGEEGDVNPPVPQGESNGNIQHDHPPVEQNDAPTTYADTTEEPARKPYAPAPAPPKRRAKHNGHDQEPVHYGPGVPIVLSDPATIVDVKVLSGEHESGILASHILRSKGAGFQPEVVVVYPTADPQVAQSHLVFVKRQR